MEKEEEDKATTIESLERDVEVRVLSLVFSSSFSSRRARWRRSKRRLDGTQIVFTRLLFLFACT
jgi:hypothetical protein